VSIEIIHFSHIFLSTTNTNHKKNYFLIGYI